MSFESPDIDVFKRNLDATIEAVQKHQINSHPAIKIQSLLNVTVYVMATRFLEGSVKHIVFNCCKMKGYDGVQLNEVEQTLKRFNNPEFSNIQELFKEVLNFDIADGLRNGSLEQSDVTFLNQIVQNRHRNVHATPDSSEWYNQNTKDINNFLREYPGLLNVVQYLDSLVFASGSSNVTARSRSGFTYNPVTSTHTVPIITVKKGLWMRIKSVLSSLIYGINQR